MCEPITPNSQDLLYFMKLETLTLEQIMKGFLPVAVENPRCDDVPLAIVLRVEAHNLCSPAITQSPLLRWPSASVQNSFELVFKRVPFQLSNILLNR